MDIDNGNCHPENKSDRKALEILTTKLHSLKQVSLSNYIKSPENVKAQPKAAKTKRVAKPRKTKIVNYKLSPKITEYNGWIETSKAKMFKENYSENDLLQMEKPKKKNCQKKLDLGEKRESKVSASYRKYGVKVPSINSILKDIKDNEQFQECVNNLKFDDYTVVNSDFEEICQKKWDNIFDCKHMSDEDITEAFEKNLSFMKDIFNGTRYSKRHELFHRKTSVSTSFIEKNLIYNTSMITFTQEQKKILLKMMIKTFTQQHMDYFFQVLLPELCLKIFIDEHNMTNEDAVKYLREGPVE